MAPRHVALAVLVAALWGFNFVVIKVGLEDVPPLLLSSLRYALASVAVLVIAPRRSVPWRWIAAVGLIIGTVKFSLLFVGMDVGVPAGLASLVLQAQAFFTLLFAAVVLGERPRRLQVAGMALALAGIGLVAIQADGGAISIGGLALVVLAAAAWGAGNLVIKRAGATDMVGFMTWTCLVPPIPLLILSLGFEGPDAVGDALTHPTWAGVASVVYLAVFATVIGWAAWGFLLGRYSPGVVAPFSLLVPVFGLVSGALVLGEGLTLLDLVATVLILAGLACIVLRSTRSQLPLATRAMSPSLQPSAARSPSTS
jgi:O-acetylserine/cysteine efflux transporter